MDVKAKATALVWKAYNSGHLNVAQELEFLIAEFQGALEEAVHTEQVRFPDSVTVGSPTKGGEFKLYYNANNPEETRERIEQGRIALELALRAQSDPKTSIKVTVPRDGDKPVVDIIQPEKKE